MTISATARRRGLVTMLAPASAMSSACSCSTSAKFRRVGDDHEIGVRPHDVKHFVHPGVGALELTCRRLVDPGQAHSLMVCTAVPGSESHEKLQMLSVIGAQTLR
jgi:hypothetical protein